MLVRGKLTLLYTRALEAALAPGGGGAARLTWCLARGVLVEASRGVAAAVARLGRLSVRRRSSLEAGGARPVLAAGGGLDGGRAAVAGGRWHGQPGQRLVAVGAAARRAPGAGEAGRLLAQHVARHVAARRLRHEQREQRPRAARAAPLGTRRRPPHHVAAAVVADVLAHGGVRAWWRASLVGV